MRYFIGTTLLGLVIITGCSSTEPQPVNDNTSQRTTINQNISKENTTTKEFDITASQFAFDPETITVSKGDTVVLNVTSEDVTHGIAIAEFNVSKSVEPGVTERIEFVADEVGTYEMVCSVACGAGHKDMVGTLIVQ